MRIEDYWYSRSPVVLFLLPLSLLFGAVTTVRRWLYRRGVFRVRRAASPVIVVGNITVGGTGKTPLVIWLAEYLRSQGYKPGIVARGYGGKASVWPQQVRPDSDAVVVGDEAVLLAQRSGCPVCVGPDRAAAITELLSHMDCDIVISDDGLQHYAMARDLEICVVDGERGFGNGFLLPAGPLRESTSRLSQVDLVITNGIKRKGTHGMSLRQPEVVQLDGSGDIVPLGRFNRKRVHAVAGIGNPERFFRLLTGNELDIVAHPFPDHHAYTAADLVFDEELPILMTEKDAVKCRRFPGEQRWAVRIAAQPDAAFTLQLNSLLKELNHG